MSDDLVVVVPGIMGSTLVRDGRELWGPSAGTVLGAIRSLGASVRRLSLPSDLGDDDPADGVEAVRLVPDLHVIPGLWSVDFGYRALLRRLHEVLDAQAAGGGTPPDPPRLLAFPYDWRLSNRLNGRRLGVAVERALERLRDCGGSSDARVTFVCHSMGGLVARWYVEQERGHEITRRVITIGTPHRGALKALANLANGVRRGLGPLALDLTAFARTLPSAYQLLPQYACIAANGALRTTLDAAVPTLDAALVADGTRFHAQLDDARAAGPYELRPIVGIKQATATTATIAGDRIETIETIGETDEGGDATVPRLAATPRTMPTDDAAITWVAARHGALHRSPAALDQLEGLLTARRVVHAERSRAKVGVRVPELLLPGEPLSVVATADDDVPLAAEIAPVDGPRTRPRRLRLRKAGGAQRVEIGPLPPGAHVVTVGGYGSAAAHVDPVASGLIVWGDA